MKVPKIIMRPETYDDIIYQGGVPVYCEYKYHGKVYDGCYEYIYWWLNGSGKWRCFKIYLEKGNTLYRDWCDYLQGKETRTKFVEW